MADVIKDVFNLVDVALSTKPNHVKVNEETTKELGKLMLQKGPVSFFDGEKLKYITGISHIILKELVASSINYCYWYGSHDVRPNNVSSTSMYEDVETIFGKGNTALLFESRIDKLVSLLSHHKYPLLEDRKRHLYDLCEGRKAEEFVAMVNSKQYSGEKLLNEMVQMFTGFASDLFLKRASLFFIQLNRIFGWFPNLMNKIFVPADYQVPKILKYYGCIEYSNPLKEKIQNKQLIQSSSLEEIQIRAATIKVCNELKNITGWSIADIDTYLWTKRKMTDEPFHLTITTNY